MKLTQKDAQAKMQRIEKLKKEIYDLQKNGVDKDDNEDMGFRFNASAILADNQKEMLLSILSREEAELKAAEIIDVLDIPDNIVGLNDIIDVVLHFEGELPEDATLQITDTMDSEYTPVSTASPIGRAIYGQAIGSVVTCKTPRGMLTVQIISKKCALIK